MSRRTIGNVFPNRYDREAPASTSNTNPSNSQVDSIVVRFCIAIVSNLGNDNQPNMQLLTPPDERISVLLGSVRTFADIRRCLRLLLRATLARHGILSTNMTHSAVILPASRRPQGNGLLGVTDDENVWQTYINVVTNMYHPPCGQPETCQTCREPAIIVACFPEDAWDENPGRSITMRDTYSAEHGMALRRVSTIEEQRYIRLVNRLVNARSTSNATVQRPVSGNPQSPPPQSNFARPANTDPTKGPKGRTLLGTQNADTNKKDKDYSKGTLYPATAEKGTKREEDTCLTCIRYGRKCKGTTMTLVNTSRSGRKSQYKCDQCRNPQRRCLWRPSMNKVTTYYQAFKADGGQSLEKNTVQGRRDRASERSAAAKKGLGQGEGGDGEDSDEDGDVKGDEDEDEE